MLNPSEKQLAALMRLIEIAKRDTGQSGRVAGFLLAWWNAHNCGGFDLTDFWSVDAEIAQDMITVLGLIIASRSYPQEFKDEFAQIIRIWRPNLLD